MKVIVLILVIAALVKVGNAAIHSIQRESKRVNACVFNPAYQGSTPEATRYLYNKCRTSSH